MKQYIIISGFVDSSEEYYQCKVIIDYIYFGLMIYIIYEIICKVSYFKTHPEYH